MRKRAILLAAACGMASVASAQQGQTAAAVNINATKVELSLSHPTQMIDKVACNSSGNIYARVWAGDGSDTARIPIQEITPEGSFVGKFSVEGPTQDTDLAKGIFVSDADVVYQMARTASGIYVTQFARDGSVKSSTQLEADPVLVDPWQLAVFKAGGYLLSGLTGKGHRTPYTAVFDAKGKMVKKIYEPEDEEARQRAESGDQEYTRSNAGNQFVGFGDATAGIDGNVYLLRGTSPTLVYAISPVGQVLRKLRIDAGTDYIAGEIKSYAGRLAIGFNSPGDQVLVVITDLEGKTTARYTVNRHKPDWPTLACYDPKGFTFVTTYAEKGLYLLRANLQ